jgi:3-deoxy-7-phosphoheptulonate synthase
MHYKIQDLHVISTEPLLAPRVLKQELPVTDSLAKFVFEARDVVRRIIHGLDPRLLCVVGPCSIHDLDAALDYAQRLRDLQRRTADALYLVMRVYFEKPRTTVGWKGLINDPLMDESCNVELGLRTARKLLLEINQLGLPAATEMLDPITPQYIADLVSWAAIGARTSESQVHRQMASGLSMPVGFKNTTDGNLEVAVNAVNSARRPHSFFGITQDGVPAVVRTSGNPDTHVVLRGGSKAPNYDPRSILECCELLRQSGLTPRVMVDCSHAQTGKDYTKQPAVLAALMRQVEQGSTALMGVMLESNIFAGSQKPSHDRSKLKYGVSVTDPCIDWETTERSLTEAARVLEERKSATQGAPRRAVG